MKYKAVIFDMDGTILNTLDDLADATNHSLRVCGYPERSIDEVRQFVGNGIRKLIERAVPINTSVSDIDRVFNTFIEYYKDHSAIKTCVYQGISELLHDLRKSGCKTGVVSNKADFAVQDLCKKYFKDMFDVSVGERAGVQRKPAPDSLNEALRLLNCEKADAIYVGDSDVDIETAKNAGIPCIGVAWGFRGYDFLKQHGASYIVSTVDELNKLLF